MSHGYRQKIGVFFREADYGAAGAIALSPMSAATVDSMASARSGAGVLEVGHQLGRNGPIRTEKNPVDVHVEDGVVIR